jgi:ectoine hydroxylase-related dioxygenase (phytanoyl-CoA dioxygenase family)
MSLSKKMERKIDLLAGIKEKFNPQSEEDYHVEEISRNGYTILEDIISKKEVQFLQGGIIEKIYTQQVEEIGGEKELKSIGDEHSVKHLLSYDNFFLDLITKQKVISLAGRFLPDNFILYLQNGVINFPKLDNPASTWHRDLPHQHYTSSRPLAISALHIVDDFNEENGGTIVLPGSHKFDEFPSKRFALKHQKQITAKAGSVLVFDSMMFHQCGYNQSNNVRRSISHIYNLPLMKQQISLPKLLNGKHMEDHLLKRLLGYDNEPAENVLQYRKQKIESRGGKSGEGYGRISKLED